MPNSYSRQAELTCPQCGGKFAAEIWLIADVAEQPDLLERPRAGKIHTVACPRRGHEGEVDAPVLVYRPGEQPPLLFVPAWQTTAEQDREQAAWLVATLQERLGDEWQDEWVVQGVPGIPQEMLPLALAEDPEAALHRMAEEAQKAVERLQEENPEAYRQPEEATRKAWEEFQKAAPLLQALGEATSPAALLRVALEHPILLEEEGERAIREMAEAARRAGQGEMANALEERYRALREMVDNLRTAGIPLEQALLYARASSLVVGLWSVNAVTTAYLMAYFYRRLRGDRVGKAVALREAALALRDGRLLPPDEAAKAKIDLSDPYYWASFALIGSWE